MGYCIAINGEKVWESEGDPMLVDRVSFNNARGEVTVVGSSNQDSYLNIEVNVRDPEGPETYLDMVEFRKANERRDAGEAAAKAAAKESAKTEKVTKKNAKAEAPPEELVGDLEL